MAYMKHKLPKYLQDRCSRLEMEADLIDGCKYMLYLEDGWSWHGLTSIPVKSISEAKLMLKAASK